MLTFFISEMFDTCCSLRGRVPQNKTSVEVQGSARQRELYRSEKTRASRVFLGIFKVNSGQLPL